ncbi:hypothetical protein [Aurantibacter sp.]|uniref:hypothetical protein n=1 Tax=Aurantibacter sp. TaxID=2807103 RepID=UPI00326601E6
MTKFKNIFFLIFAIAICTNSLAQDRIERQHRITKSQFPLEAIETLTNNSTGIKRLKYYQEIDTIQKTYTAKFKKSRLYYEMDFDNNGVFEALSFSIKQVDIPEDSFQKISNYLEQNFENIKVRKMLQLYSSNSEQNIEKTIKNAFQNLMVPDMNYKLLVRGKLNKRKTDIEVLFDASGDFISQKELLPPNYDRVLY